MSSEEFCLVLPSNSSMKYFPDNTTSCFNTELSHEVRLSGNWAVTLTEIHIPCTMVNIQKDECEIIFTKTSSSGSTTITANDNDEKHKHKKKQKKREYSDTFFPPGIYDSLKDLAEAINNVRELHGYLLIALSKKKRGYYNIRKICECKEAHYYSFSEKVKRIFGFENEKYRLEDFINLKLQSPESRYKTITRNRPACLASAISDQFFVYSDICIPYTVGDIQASLLRIVVLDNSKYKLGVTMVKQFAPPNYMPVLNNTFQNVTIDTKDQHGIHIPFEYGTLTVTLHFKRCQ
ncbi:hypothetical protein TSAR_016912 [Trichomalopsis sarcophagae]|uniref:Uncharacterized protein n=1 Tax=Trichomalopsis sarcophagae TaxID=543379 RepID=A0A232F5J2_9HYME|nr:hypothetical protein TSAR_016912 [Trichomalopsis sarcophagae]